MRLSPAMGARFPEGSYPKGDISSTAKKVKIFDAKNRIKELHDQRKKRKRQLKRVLTTD